MGLTFKENCPDFRNTKVVDILRELFDYNVVVDIFDPWVDVEEARREYGFTPVAEPQRGSYDAVVLAVAHDEFRSLGAKAIRAFGKTDHILFDLKYILRPEEADLRL